MNKETLAYLEYLKLQDETAAQVLISKHAEETAILLPVALIDVCGGVHSRAVLLAQIAYWSKLSEKKEARIRYQRDEHYWIVKRDEEWAMETRISLRNVQEIMNWLANAGLIVSEVWRSPFHKDEQGQARRARHVRINWKAYLAKYNEAVNSILTESVSLESLKLTESVSYPPSKLTESASLLYSEITSSEITSSFSEASSEGNPTPTHNSLITTESPASDSTSNQQGASKKPAKSKPEPKPKERDLLWEWLLLIAYGVDYSQEKPSGGIAGHVNSMAKDLRHIPLEELQAFHKAYPKWTANYHNPDGLAFPNSGAGIARNYTQWRKENPARQNAPTRVITTNQNPEPEWVRGGLEL